MCPWAKGGEWSVPEAALGKACQQVCWLRLWAPLYRRDMDILEKVQQRDTKMMKGPEHLTCEERLRKLGLFSLEKAQRDLINIHIDT